MKAVSPSKINANPYMRSGFNTANAELVAQAARDADIRVMHSAFLDIRQQRDLAPPVNARSPIVEDVD